MTKASIVLRQYFDRINDIESFLDLFADDGVFEFSQLRTIGLPTRYEGKSAIRSLLQMVQSKVSPFTFNNIVTYDMLDPYQIFVEYESEPLIKATGRLYIQKYASRRVVDDTERSSYAGISRHHC
jgi:ketosteroid isomerase-like protein